MLQLFLAIVVLLFLGLFIVLSVPLTDDEEDGPRGTTENPSVGS